MLQNCPKKNTLLSRHLVAIINEIHSNKVCVKDTELTVSSSLKKSLIDKKTYILIYMKNKYIHYYIT